MSPPLRRATLPTARTRAWAVALAVLVLVLALVAMACAITARAQQPSDADADVPPAVAKMMAGASMEELTYPEQMEVIRYSMQHGRAYGAGPAPPNNNDAGAFVLAPVPAPSTNDDDGGDDDNTDIRPISVEMRGGVSLGLGQAFGRAIGEAFAQAFGAGGGTQRGPSSNCAVFNSLNLTVLGNPTSLEVTADINDKTSLFAFSMCSTAKPSRQCTAGTSCEGASFCQVGESGMCMRTALAANPPMWSTMSINGNTTVSFSQQGDDDCSANHKRSVRIDFVCGDESESAKSVEEQAVASKLIEVRYPEDLEESCEYRAVVETPLVCSL